MKPVTWMLLIGAMLLSACSTYQLSSSSYKPGSELTDGQMIYYLPKTILDIKVTYGVVVKTTYDNGKITKANPEYKVNALDVTPRQINDKERAFVANSNDDKFFLAQNTNIKFNQFGVVQSFSSELEDKSLDFVEDALKGAASIAKVVAIAGDESDPLINEIQAKIKKANSDLVKAIAKKDLKAIDEIKSQLIEYYEVLKNFYDNNKVVTAESEVAFSYTVDPVVGTVTLQPNTAAASTIPPVKIKIDQIAAKGGSAPAAGALSGTLQGLVYAIPEVCRVSATAVVKGGDQILFDKAIPLSQYGALGVLPVNSKMFASKKTSIEFDPATGTLASINTESGSSSDKLGKSLASTAELLKTTVSDLKYDQKIENLKKEKELKDLKESLITKPAAAPTQADSLKTQIDILKLQIEMEKLKKEMQDAKKAE